MDTKKFCRLLSMLLSMVMCLAVLPEGIARAEGNSGVERFADVPGDHMNYDAIEYVVAKGYFNGISETAFAPDAPMSRAMFVTVLGRYANAAVQPDPDPDFSDVVPESYYSGYVAWAEENKIVQGYSRFIFGSDEHITREQAAVFLYRYAQFLGLDVRVGQTADPLTFNGGSNASPWALKAVMWAMSNGLLANVGNDPDHQAVISRAQVAQLLMNFARYVGE